MSAQDELQGLASESRHVAAWAMAGGLAGLAALALADAEDVLRLPMALRDLPVECLDAGTDDPRIRERLRAVAEGIAARGNPLAT